MKGQSTRNKQQQKTVPNYHFSYRQKAVFALVSNWAQNQFEDGLKTQHFFNLVNKWRVIQEEDIAFYKERIAQLRNFFSHGHHDDLPKLNQAEIAKLDTILKRLIIRYLAKNEAETNRDKEKQKKLDEVKLRIQKNQPLLSFSQKPFNAQNHPELVFILAPFITAGQLRYLLDRIYLPDKRKTDDRALFEVFSILAQSDSIVVRTEGSEAVRDPWLSIKQEQGFAIWDYLQKRHASGEHATPDDNYVIRQLVRFIEQNHVIENAHFLRVKTIRDTEDETKLSQEADYLPPYQPSESNDEGEAPLKIANNTVRLRLGEEDAEGTFSLKILIYIVAFYLAGENPSNLTNVIKGQLMKNKEYGHRPKRAVKQEKDLTERIKSRLCFLLRHYEQPPKNLQEQIRFICQCINRVHKEVHHHYLNKNDYSMLEDKVRYYTKTELSEWLSNLKLLDKSAIQMGRGNEKNLKQLLKKDRIQQVYLDMKKAHCDWLKGIKEGLHKKQVEEQKQIAAMLGCREVKREAQSTPSAPVGVQLKWLTESFSNLFEGENGLINLLSSHSAPYEFEKPVKKKRSKENRQLGWSHAKPYIVKQILLNMAWHNIKDITDGNLSKSDRFPDIASIPFCIDIRNARVKMTFGKSWRRHAKKDKKYLGGLIAAYADGKQNIVLSRVEAEGVNDTISFEELEIEARKERILFIQAVLEWEAKWLKENKSRISELRGKKNHLNFDIIAQTAKLEKTVQHLRNDAFHKVFKSGLKFSNCPEPIKAIYDRLEKKFDDIRRHQQNKARNTKKG